MEIRDASLQDIEGITAIYNDTVDHTTAIWNETPVDNSNRRACVANREKAGYPVLVTIDAAGDVLGYASFGDWNARDGYLHTIGHSAYIRANQRGNGIGKALLFTLIERARAIGKHVMVAGIEASNSGSIKLHEQLGFEHVGHLKEVGTKFDKWLDLVFPQLKLDERTIPDQIKAS